MANTVIQKIHWKIRNSGQIVPTLVVEPTHLPGPSGKLRIQNVFGYSAQYIMERNAGVGAYIFLDTPQRFSVNLEMVPDVPQNCLCGSATKMVGRHLVCPHNKCEYRGNGTIVSSQSIWWVSPRRF